MRVGDRIDENSVWSYEDPFDEGDAYAGYLAFYWDKADQWFEGDEEIVEQPRNAPESG